MKRRYTRTKLHGATSKSIAIFVEIAIGISNRLVLITFHSVHVDAIIVLLSCICLTLHVVCSL